MLLSWYQEFRPAIHPKFPKGKPLPPAMTAEIEGWAWRPLEVLPSERKRNETPPIKDDSFYCSVIECLHEPTFRSAIESLLGSPSPSPGPSNRTVALIAEISFSISANSFLTASTMVTNSNVGDGDVRVNCCWKLRSDGASSTAGWFGFDHRGESTVPKIELIIFRSDGKTAYESRLGLSFFDFSLLTFDLIDAFAPDPNSKASSFRINTFLNS